MSDMKVGVLYPQHFFVLKSAQISLSLNGEKPSSTERQSDLLRFVCTCGLFEICGRGKYRNREMQFAALNFLMHMARSGADCSAAI